MMRRVIASDKVIFAVSQRETVERKIFYDVGQANPITPC